MDAQLKAKWVEALRSGEYRQTKNILWSDEQETPMFCCLGVLCVVAGVEPNQEAYPWLKKRTGNYDPFVMMNDDKGKSFDEIADYIERKL